MNIYSPGDTLKCSECKGYFNLHVIPMDYDPTYCPYCGSESLSRVLRN